MAGLVLILARSTLFRSNTPLTHLLESTMRLFCGDFLARSIGSVIHRIINNRIRCEIDTTKARVGVGKAEGALRVKEGTSVLLGLAEQCFAGLYGTPTSDEPRLTSKRSATCCQSEWQPRRLRSSCQSTSPSLPRPHGCSQQTQS